MAMSVAELSRRYRARHPGAAAAAQRKFRLNHPEAMKAMRLKWLEKNKEADVARRRAYAKEFGPRNEAARRAANPEKFREARRAWDARNPAKCVEKCARRRATKIHATPAWADHEIMELIYAEAAHRRLTVDHIVPLRGKNVCGLHVYNNTQLLTMVENSRKGNRYEK